MLGEAGRARGGAGSRVALATAWRARLGSCSPGWWLVDFGLMEASPRLRGKELGREKKKKRRESRNKRKKEKREEREKENIPIYLGFSIHDLFHLRFCINQSLIFRFLITTIFYKMSQIRTLMK